MTVHFERGGAALRARIRTYGDKQEIMDQIKSLRTEDEAIWIMTPKAMHFNILVEDLRPPEAIILKESFLSVGGDVAIHRDAITNRIERLNVLVMATRKQLKKVVPNLRMQPFKLGELADEMLRAADNFMRTPSPWKLPDGRELSFDSTRVMGIINMTADSFSGDGLGDNVELAVKKALEMEEAGADIVDVGGESTKPGATPLDAEKESKKIIPVIEKLADKLSIPISVDTYKPVVARAAIDAGASIVNDVTGLADEDMICVCKEKSTPVIVMHMKGTPKDMQENPLYEDVVGEIMHFLSDRVERATAEGLSDTQIAVDPGIGFGKRMEDNLEIIRRLPEFRTLGHPISLGASRKWFIGQITGRSAEERIEGSIAAACAAAMNGADIIRCHDVGETKRAIDVLDAIISNRGG